MSFPSDVVFIQDPSNGVYFTGVLISPDEVLTVGHGVQTNGIFVPATDLVVTSTSGFDFDANPTGPRSGVVSFHSNAVQTSPYVTDGHDMALLKLSTPIGFETGYAHLGVDYHGAATDFGYPGGSWSGPEITTVTAIPGGGSDVVSISSSLPGNSGGPIFAGIDLVNLTDQVVALYAGAPAGVPQGTPNEGIATAISAVNAAQIEQWMAQDGESPAVERLYQGVLDRTPDYAGLISWSKVVADQDQTETQIAGSFLRSDEFVQKHGANINTANLIDLLYQQALGRTPEAGAVAAWEHSGLSAEMIVVGITQSVEAVAHSPIY